VQVNGLEPASEEEQQKAAVKIQAGIRGYRDRQRVKALRSVYYRCCVTFTEQNACMLV